MNEKAHNFHILTLTRFCGIGILKFIFGLGYLSVQILRKNKHYITYSQYTH